MEPVISLQDVALRYRRAGNIFQRNRYFEALKCINLNVYEGETLGIIGRNGAGKSSLLKVISQIILPDRGRVINRGVSVSMLALQTGFDFNLSGRDNAVLSGMLQGFTRREVEARLDEIQEYSELGEFFFEPVRTYSTGMCARLGFSVSTIISPNVLLVDEVLGVGDKHFREKAERTMIEKIESKQTVIFVSHSYHQISLLCDRAVLIEGGVSLLTGEPRDVIDLYEERLQTTPTGYDTRTSNEPENLEAIL
ncbi:MAG: ABC transporter ATP-binding protein [Methylococcales bacterium]